MKRPAPAISKESPQARRERVAAIKAQVQAGTYTVEPLEVSKKIIDKHLSRKPKA